MAGLGLVLDLSYGGFVAATPAAGGGPVARHWRAPGQRHDGIGAWVEVCLAEAGGGFSDLRWVCVGIGPGSFTGIRIAMAFAQGLGFPGNIPLHGFLSFAPLLLAPGKNSSRVAAIPAQPGRFYAARALDDPGSMVDVEGLRAMGGPDKELFVPALSPALDAVASAFTRVAALAADWDVAALAEHSRASGLGASRPHYLSVPAAEAKAGEANHGR